MHINEATTGENEKRQVDSVDWNAEKSYRQCFCVGK